MSIYVIGANGKVGKQLLKHENCYPIFADITNKKQIRDEIFKLGQNDTVALLASISDVDECEKSENTEKVKNTNFVGVRNVADACEEVGCGIMFLSTDHVFDGKKLERKEKDKTSPVNYYGITKLAAESLSDWYDNFRVVRTSTLFQFDMERIQNPIQGLKFGKSIDVPDFYFRSFMYIPHFVSNLYQYLVSFKNMPKILHLSGSLTVSWYKFVQDLAITFGYDPILVKSRNFEVGGFAPRPKLAGLNTYKSQRLGFSQYSYLDGLKEMFNETNS